MHGHPVPALVSNTTLLTDSRERPSDSTLAEWIRHCKRSGLYEQGKLRYEKGGLNIGHLSEDALVSVEEDYQICARMFARNAGVPEEAGEAGRIDPY